jgi:uncharacterized damage-inducible protein DinB
METTVGETLAEQFSRTWEMTREIVTQCPEDHWRNGGVPRHVPARWVLHAVETADFYARPGNGGWTWGDRFGVDWKTARPDELPSREDMLAYLEEVRRRLDTWLRAAADDELLRKRSDFAWTGASLLARLLYLLRHTQHHVGQVNQILKSQGVPLSKWK